MGGVGWKGTKGAGLRGGVATAPADLFAVGRGGFPPAVRLGLGAARDHRELERALGVIRDTLADTAAGGSSIL